MQTDTSPSAHVCTPTPTPPAERSQAITKLRKRLKRWELDHLRAHCAELAERLAAAQTLIETQQSEILRAWEAADSWRDQTYEMLDELHHAGNAIGLTQDGVFVVMATTAEEGVPA